MARLVRSPVSSEEIVAAAIEADATPPPPKRTRRTRRAAGVKTPKQRELERLSPRMRDLAEGRISIEDLDTEELMRGQLRGEDGNFHGKRPYAIPRVMHDKMAEEIQKRMQLMFNGQLQMTFDVMVEMAQNPRTQDRERLAAAQYLMERAIGPITQKQEIKQETVTRFEGLVQNGGFLVDLGETVEEIEE